MKVLVFYSRLTTYWLACMRTARDLYGAQFLVYRFTPAKEAPFELTSEAGITIKVSSLLQERKEALEISLFVPDVVYVAGWNNKNYLTLAQRFKEKGVPVITGMDNHWQGTSKQRLAALLAPFYLKKYFDYIWVPGTWQYSYALKLGFKKEQILEGLYAADVDQFLSPSAKVKKRFVFAGRLVYHKGIDMLLDAFSLFCRIRKDWELYIIGNGEEQIVNSIRNTPNTTHFAFMEAPELAALMKEGGVFMLPSRYEAWGVVVHEAVASGMPVIASTECGATTAFVKNNYNGLVVRPEVQSILAAMKEIADLEMAQLEQMSHRSLELSLTITPALWAAQLYNVTRGK